MLANDLPIANAGKFNKIRNCQNAYAAVYVNILSKTECSKSGGWPDPQEPFIASLFKEPVAGSLEITQCYRQSEDPIAKDFYIVTGSECPAGDFRHSTDAITNLGYALASPSAGTIAVYRLWDAYALSRTPPVMDRLKENVFNHRASINPGQYSSSKDEGVFGYWIKNPNNQFIQGLLTLPPSVEVSPPPSVEPVAPGVAKPAGPCADYIAEIAQLRERIDEKKSECDRRIKEMKERCEKEEDCTEVKVEINSLKKQISDYEKLLYNLKQLLD
jgi:hypothetical protein